MTKLKGPLFSLDARNTLAGVITFARRRKQNIAEKIPIPPDAKSLAQLSWRHMYQKAVALWHALSAAEQQEWESLARPKHMTGFAWFMSQALRPNPGLYLPLQGGTMSGDIDMAKHRLLKLPAPADAQEPATKTWTEALIAASLYTQGARVYNNAHIAIPNATWTIMTFNSERWDTDDIHSVLSNTDRLTCKTAGKYCIIGQIGFASNATGMRSIRIFTTGPLYLAATKYTIIGGGSDEIDVVTIFNLSVNQWVKLQVYQNSTGPLNAEYSPGMHCEFMMQRIV